MTTKQKIHGAVEDLVASLLYYDRKEDEDLVLGEIEDAITAGEVTVDELTNVFYRTLKANVQERKRKAV